MALCPGHRGERGARRCLLLHRAYPGSAQGRAPRLQVGEELQRSGRGAGVPVPQPLSVAENINAGRSSRRQGVQGLQKGLWTLARPPAARGREPCLSLPASPLCRALCGSGQRMPGGDNAQGSRATSPGSCGIQQGLGMAPWATPLLAAASPGPGGWGRDSERRGLVLRQQKSARSGSRCLFLPLLLRERRNYLRRRITTGQKIAAEMEAPRPCRCSTINGKLHTRYRALFRGWFYSWTQPAPGSPIPEGAVPSEGQRVLR